MRDGKKMHLIYFKHRNCLYNKRLCLLKDMKCPLLGTLFCTVMILKVISTFLNSKMASCDFKIIEMNEFMTQTIILIFQYFEDLYDQNSTR